MNIRTNIGYIITDSVHIGETEFVIGIHQHDPNRFVTWARKNGNDYFWGHYLNSREAAEKRLSRPCHGAAEASGKHSWRRFRRKTFRKK